MSATSVGTETGIDLVQQGCCRVEREGVEERGNLPHWWWWRRWRWLRTALSEKRAQFQCELRIDRCKVSSPMTIVRDEPMQSSTTSIFLIVFCHNVSSISENRNYACESRRRQRKYSHVLWVVFYQYNATLNSLAI